MTPWQGRPEDFWAPMLVLTPGFLYGTLYFYLTLNLFNKDCQKIIKMCFKLINGQRLRQRRSYLGLIVK